MGPERKSLHRSKYAKSMVGLLVVLPVAIYFCSGPLLHLNDDAFQEYFSHGFFRRMVQQDNAIPLWCPYAGGGYPLYAHPHDASSVLPMNLAILWLGEVWGVKLNILLLWLIGLWGMRRLLIDHTRLERGYAGLAVGLYGVNPFFVDTVAGGNYNETWIIILPAILACQQKARKSVPWLLGAALMLAGLFAFGKFTALVASILAGVFGLKLALEREGDKRPGLWPGILSLIVLFAMTLGLAAIKLVPMLDLLSRARLGQPYDAGPWVGVGVGSIFWIAAVCAALLLGRFSGRWFWAVLLALVLAVAAGSGFPVNLGRTVGLLPGFKEVLHQPTKYWLIPAWMLMCMVLGDWIVARGKRYRATVVLVLIVFLSVVGSVKMIRTWQESMIWAPRFAECPFFQVKGQGMPVNGLRTRHSNQYYNLLRNVGTIDWYSDQIDLPQSAIPRYMVEPGEGVVFSDEAPVQKVEMRERLTVNADYPGEISFIGRGEGIGRVESFRILTNRIEVWVEMITPGRVVINQNHDAYWLLGGEPSPEYRGRLASGELAPGMRELVWTYEPEPWRNGFAVSKWTLLVGIALLCVWEGWRRWRRR